MKLCILDCILGLDNKTKTVETTDWSLTNWFEFGSRDSDDVWFGTRWEGDTTQQFCGAFAEDFGGWTQYLSNPKKDHIVGVRGWWVDLTAQNIFGRCYILWCTVHIAKRIQQPQRATGPSGSSNHCEAQEPTCVPCFVRWTRGWLTIRVESHARVRTTCQTRTHNITKREIYCRCLPRKKWEAKIWQSCTPGKFLLQFRQSNSRGIHCAHLLQVAAQHPLHWRYTPISTNVRLANCACEKHLTKLIVLLTSTRRAQPLGASTFQKNLSLPCQTVRDNQHSGTATACGNSPQTCCQGVAWATYWSQTVRARSSTRAVSGLSVCTRHACMPNVSRTDSTISLHVVCQSAREIFRPNWSDDHLQTWKRRCMVDTLDKINTQKCDQSWKTKGADNSVSNFRQLPHKRPFFSPSLSGQSNCLETISLDRSSDSQTIVHQALTPVMFNPGKKTQGERCWFLSRRWATLSGLICDSVHGDAWWVPTLVQKQLWRTGKMTHRLEDWGTFFCEAQTRNQLNRMSQRHSQRRTFLQHFICILVCIFSPA